MTRSALAVIAGFLTTVLIVVATTFLFAKVTGVTDTPNAAYLVLNLAGSAVAAFVGARVTGMLAMRRHMLHAGILALLIALLSAPAIAAPPAGQPGWYPATVTLLGIIGAMAGGRFMALRSGRAAAPPPAA